MGIGHGHTMGMWPYRTGAWDRSTGWAPGGTPKPPVLVPVELRAHLQDGRQEPEYQTRLCFGEEYPGPPDQPEERLIMAHVEPVFTSELFLHSSSTTVVSQRWQVPSPASPMASLTCSRS